mmetsp:Transcript_36218/g.90365  ORF Transcript_36218/g.90365 Transcript_36218/m.90365 type:complete len:246 (+) Transcript_36218:546-1283(+)
MQEDHRPSESWCVEDGREWRGQVIPCYWLKGGRRPHIDQRKVVAATRRTSFFIVGWCRPDAVSEVQPLPRGLLQPPLHLTGHPPHAALLPTTSSKQRHHYPPQHTLRGGVLLAMQQQLLRRALPDALRCRTPSPILLLFLCVEVPPDLDLQLQWPAEVGGVEGEGEVEGWPAHPQHGGAGGGGGGGGGVECAASSVEHRDLVVAQLECHTALDEVGQLGAIRAVEDRLVQRESALERLAVDREDI